MPPFYMATLIHYQSQMNLRQSKERFQLTITTTINVKQLGETVNYTSVTMIECQAQCSCIVEWYNYNAVIVQVTVVQQLNMTTCTWDKQFIFLVYSNWVMQLFSPQWLVNLPLLINSNESICEHIKAGAWLQQTAQYEWPVYQAFLCGMCSVIVCLLTLVSSPLNIGLD